MLSVEHFISAGEPGMKKLKLSLLAVALYLRRVFNAFKRAEGFDCKMS